MELRARPQPLELGSLRMPPSPHNAGVPAMKLTRGVSFASTASHTPTSVQSPLRRSFTSTPLSTMTVASSPVEHYPPGVGYTPLGVKIMAPGTIIAPGFFPSAAGVANGAVPSSAVAFGQSSPKRAFPPGLGYTPLAAAPGRSITKSFGMAAQHPLVSMKETKPADVEDTISEQTAMHDVDADEVPAGCQSVEDVFSREFLLLFKDGHAFMRLSAEEAGFVLPAPGFILSAPSSNLPGTGGQEHVLSEAHGHAAATQGAVTRVGGRARGRGRGRGQGRSSTKGRGMAVD